MTDGFVCKLPISYVGISQRAHRGGSQKLAGINSQRDLCARLAGMAIKCMQMKDLPLSLELRAEFRTIDPVSKGGREIKSKTCWAAGLATLKLCMREGGNWNLQLRDCFDTLGFAFDDIFFARSSTFLLTAAHLVFSAPTASSRTAPRRGTTAVCATGWWQWWKMATSWTSAATVETPGPSERSTPPTPRPKSLKCCCWFRLFSSFSTCRRTSADFGFSSRWVHVNIRCYCK